MHDNQQKAYFIVDLVNDCLKMKIRRKSVTDLITSVEVNR